MGSSRANNGVRVVVGTGWALLMLAATEACGAGGAPSSAQICATLCDCITCPDGYLEDCEAALDDLEREAADAGCAAEYDAHTTCYVDELRCDNNPIDLDDPPPTCVTERSAYEQCISSATEEGCEGPCAA
jgi:hypothetical protein